MSRFDRNRSILPEPQLLLGAREITHFGGRLANDNDYVPRSQPKRRDFALPAAAFLSGLGAASLLAVAQHWFGFQ